jgi:amino acid adenylation domain-containing protein
VYVIGGEALPATTVDLWRRMGLEARIVNEYGPTETVVGCVVYEAPKEVELSRSVPIGRPIANTRIYISDEWHEPTPVGVAGEIYIGGAGVARGYLNRPELTAERFVPDPYGVEQGARIYKTGDVGRWLPEGEIEFLGRNDFQVKLRGYRIELGEIEARMRERAGVREAVALALEDGEGGKRLVAYYTGEEVGAEELRDHLSSSLPGYMVPAGYVHLESLPLTPNGKLDRKALPEPGAGTHASRGYEPPEGEVETELARIWSELLKVEKVGRNDNFFELGGHSLLGISLIERMRREGLLADVQTLFTSPTLAELAASVSSEVRVIEVPPNRIPASCDAITPEMLPLVDLTVEEIERIVSRIPGGAANVQDIYPLVPLQEGILFHHLMREEGDVYLNSRLESFSTRSHLDSYLSAIQALINRHDILRTAVMWEGLREPVQVVCKNVVLPLMEVELDSGTENAIEQLWSRFDPRSNRLDISQAPMLRLIVTHDATQERWLLLWWYSHLLGDHVALEVMQKEIQAYLLGHEDQLPAPLSFRNFVAQARLGVSREEHEAFFRKMLSDVEEPIAPFGLLDVQGDGSGIKEERMMLDSSLAKRIRERAKKLGVSPAALCHVAWAQVLAKASGQDDVVFGTVLFGRTHGGTGAERAVGLFINTLPVRFRIGEEGVEGGVRRMQRLLAELLRHEQAPLALAQRCSRVPAPAPLFTSLFNYRHSPGVGKASSPDKLRAWEGMKVLYVEERTNYPLTFSVDDIGQDFTSTAETEASIDPKRVCEYMHTALKSLVEALESTPGRAISSLEVLPEKERKQLLYEWNATGVEYPREKCIQQLFEEQVQKTPEAVAVMYEDANLTYGELNRRANRWARCFQDAYGLCAGDLAAIQMERSSQMVECILAIWKCGAAYVPVEPDYPNDHIRGILAEARPRLVVTQEELSKIKPNLHKYQGLNLDQPVRAEDLAYVIFTSGSTGKPKGVMIEHAGMLNHLLAKIDDLEITSGSVIAQNASHCFDISVWQMFAAFLVGGQTIIYGNDTVFDPEKLLDRVKSDGVTVLEVVPSYLAALLLRLEGQRGACFRLKYLVVTGEILKPYLVDMWFKIFPNIAVINAYGPTEASDDITHYFMYTYPTVPSIPVGKPIRNTHIYVVDDKGNLCLIGVTGEICVSGAGVGRGYLNDAEKTSLAFGPDPFRSEAGARLYRTGDLGSFSAEGNLLLSGRKDDQVKIRGYRIELGEIEARLSEHPQVLEAAVAAREDGGGGKRLVAYVVVAESKVEEERVRHSLQERGEVYAGELSAMLRTYLAGQLPEYMVPATYVRLGRMPLTPNGKLDRRALPEPERDAYARGYVEPQGETESKLAKIWEKLLGAPQVGLHDNFFELGGHSLLVMQLMVEVRRLFSINISLRDVFMSPTLAELAAALKRGDLGIRHQNLIPVRPAGTQTPLFLVHALGGGVDYMVDLAPFISADIPIYGLQATGFAPGQEPLKTIEEMAELYVDGIRQIQPHGPYRVAGWSAGGTIAYEMARTLIEMGERVGFVGLLDTIYSDRMTMDSEIGPPKDFDANSELIQLLSMILDKKDLDDFIQMAQTYDFETLIERGNHIRDKIAKEYPSVHTLDISALRRILTIRHATSNALLNYSFVRLYAPVWLFEARETVPPSGLAWRTFLGDDLQVVPVQGTHHTMTSLENLRSLGAAITGALAKTSALPASHSFTNSAAEV